MNPLLQLLQQQVQSTDLVNRPSQQAQSTGPMGRSVRWQSLAFDDMHPYIADGFKNFSQYNLLYTLNYLNIKAKICVRNYTQLLTPSLFVTFLLRYYKNDAATANFNLSQKQIAAKAIFNLKCTMLPRAQNMNRSPFIDVCFNLRLRFKMRLAAQCLGTSLDLLSYALGWPIVWLIRQLE